MFDPDAIKAAYALYRLWRMRKYRRLVKAELAILRKQMSESNGLVCGNRGWCNPYTARRHEVGDTPKRAALAIIIREQMK